MRRQVLPPPRAKEKRIECLQEVFASACFAGQSLPLCTADLPLCGIPVEPTKDLAELRIKVDGVRVENLGRPRASRKNCEGRSRTDLDISQSFSRAFEF